MPTHDERRVIGHSPRQLYDLVADVERYPEFLPWCMAARVRRREGNVVVADMVIGFKMIRERFTSRVTVDPERLRVDVAYLDGPFRHLDNHWIFEDHPEGCLIDFYVDFAFRSKILQGMMEALFHEAVRRMVAAFETRAHALYGAPEAEPSGTSNAKSA